MTMRLWTYNRPFEHDGNNYEVKYSFSLKTYTSQLFCNGSLIDEHTHSFDGDFKVVEHKFKSLNSSQELTVSVGYFSWLSVGIVVRENNNLIYESHPGKDIHFATNKLEGLNVSYSSPEANEKREQQQQQWKRNKPSVIRSLEKVARSLIIEAILPKKASL